MAVLGLTRLFAADVYDLVITQRLTTHWYQTVLSRLAHGASVLDVGVGTAGALLNNASLVEEKMLNILGIDYDSAYIKKAQRAIKNAGLQSRVQVEHRSVYDTPLPQLTSRKYDAVYFSGSFTLLPDPVAALRVAEEALGPAGKIYITQTFQVHPF